MRRIGETKHLKIVSQKSFCLSFQGLYTLREEVIRHYMYIVQYVIAKVMSYF